MSARIYILGGQYGVFGTLGSLGKRLGEFGKVSYHQWNDAFVISDALSQRAYEPLVLIGYSLGANSVAAWIPGYLQRAARKVNLVVAYDPSRFSPLAPAGIEHVPNNVQRAICYYNPNAFLYGGAILQGATVQVVTINKFHLAVPFDSTLHQRTYDEVKKACPK